MCVLSAIFADTRWVTFDVAGIVWCFIEWRGEQQRQLIVGPDQFALDRRHGLGRMPVVAVLEDLSKEALVQILTKPKNAIIRQYQKLFEFENVRLKFSDDALEAIASLAMERKVGARGLRMILEDLMLDLMYYLPSYKKVREFLVTKEMVITQKINMALLEKAG